MARPAKYNRVGGSPAAPTQRWCDRSCGRPSPPAHFVAPPASRRASAVRDRLPPDGGDRAGRIRQDAAAVELGRSCRRFRPRGSRSRRWTTIRSSCGPGVIAALEQLAPGCGRVATERSRRRCAGRRRGPRLARGPRGDRLTTDAGRRARRRPPPPVRGDGRLRSRLFVQHVPSWLHVVLAGRADPPLPLDRLRGRGQLGEVRFADLRFTDAEARQMLASLAPDLSERRDRRIGPPADGWAAGVQLTGLVARRLAARRRPSRCAATSKLLHRGLRLARGAGDGGDPDDRRRRSRRSRSSTASTPRWRRRSPATPTSASSRSRRSRRACSCPGSGSRTGSASIRSCARCSATSSCARTRHRECHERAARWFEDSPARP